MPNQEPGRPFGRPNSQHPSADAEPETAATAASELRQQRNGSATASDSPASVEPAAPQGDHTSRPASVASAAAGRPLKKKAAKKTVKAPTKAPATKGTTKKSTKKAAKPGSAAGSSAVEPSAPAKKKAVKKARAKTGAEKTPGRKTAKKGAKAATKKAAKRSPADSASPMTGPMAGPMAGPAEAPVEVRPAPAAELVVGDAARSAGAHAPESGDARIVERESPAKAQVKSLSETLADAALGLDEAGVRSVEELESEAADEGADSVAAAFERAAGLDEIAAQDEAAEDEEPADEEPLAPAPPPFSEALPPEEDTGPVTEETSEFAKYGLKRDLVRACLAAGFKRPSEIQRRVIPLALAGKDVLGQSKTGSGKTASFLLPILHAIDVSRPGIQALILVPTRELAQQVNEEVRKLSRFAPVKSLAIVGGRRMRSQLDELRRNPKLVVGTPGRILDHLSRGTLDLSHIGFAVLDEVDRMLDIGFRDDIRQILKSIRSARHQTIFVSATISDEIAKLAGQYMHEPEKVYLAPDDLTVDKIEQFYCPVERHDKYRLMKLLLAAEKPERCIIFCATKRMADDLAERMSRNGLNAVEIHGDLQQNQREKVIARFRKGDIRYLVATDLASRGLDIPEVTHIINYDIPADPEVYVHRIGRTARMGATGKAITFVTREEGPQLTQIEMLINKEVPALKVEGFVATIKQPVEKPAESPAAPRPVSRFRLPVFANDEALVQAGAVPPKAPVKTLGSKFQPSRKRRR
jgi:ATP-dependent RNA helicase DeaD